MAKVTCIVTYHPRAKKNADKVTRDFQIQFGENDGFEIKTATKNLVLKVEDGDPAAQNLIGYLKAQRSNKPANMQSAPRELEDDEYVLDPVEPNNLRANQQASPKMFSVVFTKLPKAAEAKFKCGYYETDKKTGEKKFELYKGGAGQSFPSIP